MAKTLDVYLHSEFVGHLTQDNGGQMIFQYADSWMDRPGASPLSQSLLLRKKRFSKRVSRILWRHPAGREQARDHRSESRHQRP